MTDSLSMAFNNAIIEDRKLKMDVGVILGGMILKHFKNGAKQDKLLERINMKQIKKDIQRLVHDEYGDELDAIEREIEKKDKQLETKDKQLETKDKEINKLKKYKDQTKNELKKLNEQKDLSPESKQIIQSMLLL